MNIKGYTVIICIDRTSLDNILIANMGGREKLAAEFSSQYRKKYIPYNVVGSYGLLPVMKIQIHHVWLFIIIILKALDKISIT